VDFAVGIQPKRGKIPEIPWVNVNTTPRTGGIITILQTTGRIRVGNVDFAVGIDCERGILPDIH
jgi:hypothetical protein